MQPGPPQLLTLPVAVCARRSKIIWGDVSGGDVSWPPVPGRTRPGILIRSSAS
jgi:hypothetical protein